MTYQTFPEFMHNDDVSGFWIFNRPQMYGAMATAGVMMLITGSFLSLFPRVLISVIIGVLGGFLIGSKIRGVSGYIYAVCWIKYYFRLLILRDTAIYTASLSYDSSVEKSDGGRVVVSADRNSLPKIERKGG